jgi:hypothetical protein
MPIVKCTACGAIGFAVREPGPVRLAEKPWIGRECRSCGKKNLVKAKFGEDYGYKEGGDRFGVPRFDVQ